MNIETVLVLFKSDIGVSHRLRDPYFEKLIAAAHVELEKKGLTLDCDSIEDQMLIADYAAWQYRHRAENVGLARNVELRIRNRIVKERSSIN